MCAKFVLVCRKFKESFFFHELPFLLLEGFIFIVSLTWTVWKLYTWMMEENFTEKNLFISLLYVLFSLLLYTFFFIQQKEKKLIHWVKKKYFGIQSFSNCFSQDFNEFWVRAVKWFYSKEEFVSLAWIVFVLVLSRKKKLGGGESTRATRPNIFLNENAQQSGIRAFFCCF